MPAAAQRGRFSPQLSPWWLPPECNSGSWICLLNSHRQGQHWCVHKFFSFFKRANSLSLPHTWQKHINTPTHLNTLPPTPHVHTCFTLLPITQKNIRNFVELQQLTRFSEFSDSTCLIVDIFWFQTQIFGLWNNKTRHWRTSSWDLWKLWWTSFHSSLTFYGANIYWLIKKLIYRLKHHYWWYTVL